MYPTYNTVREECPSSPLLLGRKRSPLTVSDAVMQRYCWAVDCCSFPGSNAKFKPWVIQAVENVDTAWRWVYVTNEVFRVCLPRLSSSPLYRRLNVSGAWSSSSLREATQQLTANSETQTTLSRGFWSGTMLEPGSSHEIMSHTSYIRACTFDLSTSSLMQFHSIPFMCIDTRICRNLDHPNTLGVELPPLKCFLKYSWGGLECPSLEIIFAT